MNLTRRIGLFIGLVLTVQTAFSGEAITYYHNDILGSPVVATDASGYVRWKADYRPHGSRDQGLTDQLASSDNSRWYTGHVHDEDTSLTYMGARYYDPEIGRFMSVDPVGYVEENEHSFGRYTYASNNPYLYVDPDGREVWGVTFGGSFSTEKTATYGYSFTLALDTNGTFIFLSTPELGAGAPRGGSGFARALFGFGDNTVDDLLGPGFSVSGGVGKLSGSVTAPTSQIHRNTDPTQGPNLDTGPVIVEVGRAVGGSSASATVGYGIEHYRSTLLGDTGSWWGIKIYEWTHSEYDPNQ